MKKITDKRQVTALVSLCIVAYLVSYLTRKNFAAVLAQFTLSEGVEKSAASVITVSLFIFYGIGQLISGWLGDRLSPKKLMTAGLALTTLANIVMPLLGGNTSVMAVVWGINGIAQAFMWPPMVKIMTGFLTRSAYKDAVMKVSLGSAAGTMLIYGIAALFIKLFADWKPIFAFSALCGAVMTLVWYKGIGKIERYASQHGTVIAEELDTTVSTDKGTPSASLHFNPFTMSPIIVIMLAIVFQGMLRDGVEQWMPSYLSECYGIETSGAVLSCVILPLLTMVCIKVTGFIYEKYLKNELVCSAVIFLVGTLSSLLLFLFHGKSSILAIILVSLVASAMHGVNLILICMIPPHYEKYGNVSFISGLINFCTYIGSALFTYGIAKLSEILSWHTTVMSWALVAFLGTLLCVFAVPAWIRFCKK